MDEKSISTEQPFPTWPESRQERQGSRGEAANHSSSWAVLTLCHLGYATLCFHCPICKMGIKGLSLRTGARSKHMYVQMLGRGYPQPSSPFIVGMGNDGKDSKTLRVTEVGP